MKKLSTGRSSFPDLINEDCIYIDKTELLYQMINTDKFYFLSRPRRFGKSLTISTLKEIFRGNKETFKNTFIYTAAYNWKRYPIIHFDFSKIDSDDSISDFKLLLLRQINKYAKMYNIRLSAGSPKLQFDELIDELSKESKVVILVDEYDNPLINNLNNIEKVKEIQTILKGFYKIIKSQDENVRFALLTGVTKFSQVSIFSGLNNLTDITMNDKYAAICGYTEDEIKVYFKDYISKWSQKSKCTNVQMKK